MVKAVTPIPFVRARFFDRYGKPLANGKVYSYEANTTTPKITYADPYGTSLNTNPVVLDMAGEADIYLDGAYRIRVTDSHDVLISEQELVSQLASADMVNLLKYDSGITTTLQNIISGTYPRPLSEKNADTVSLMDFYDPDNDNDFTNALQRAVNSDVPVIDGGGKTYEISKPIVCTRSNVGLQNMVIKTPTAISNIVDGVILENKIAVLMFTGTQGAPVTITSMATAYGVIVDDVTGFASDDYVYLSSDAYWSGTSVKLGEIVQIASVDAATKTIKFYTSTISNKYDSTTNAKISKLSMLQNVSLNNVEVVGQDETASYSMGIIFDKCVNVSLTDVNARFFDHTHTLMRRCANVRIFGGMAHKTGDTDGVDYGLSIVEGCFDVVANGFVAQACRHAVTVGGADGVSKSITFANCRAYSSRDAAFDSHPAASNVAFLFCESWQSDDSDREQDAITAQCASLTVIGCRFTNNRRHGIVFTPMVNAGIHNDTVGMISGLNVWRNNQADLDPALTTVGLNIATAAGYAPIEYITSNGDQLSKFSYPVLIVADGATISNISINNLSNTRPSQVRTIFAQAKTAEINKVAINNCNLTNSSANEVIYLQGSATASVKNVSLTGNVLDGDGTSSAALRLLYCQNVTEGLNQYTGVTRFLTTDSASTGVKSETKRIAKAAWAGATIANGAQATIAVTLNNVAYGDIIAANLSVANQGCNVFAYMSAANTVTVVVQNNTGASKTIVACDVIVVANRFIP